MLSEEEIMCKEAFNELINNLEIVEKLTMYGRKSIKYWVTKLQQENELAKEQLKKQCEIADERNDLLVKAQKLEKENEKLKITINKQSIDISNNLLKLQQKDRQIDLMTTKILVEIIGAYPCGYKEDCIKSKKEYRDIHCKDCIKQYYETKAKKGE